MLIKLQRLLGKYHKKPYNSFLEKKAAQSEVVVNEPTSAPVLKANSGEYVAHEVKIVTSNTNNNPSPTPASSISFQGGINQGDASELSSPQGNNPNAPRQPAKNFGVGPSFLLVPKRRVLHNVRSNMKADVPGKLTISSILQEIIILF